MKCHLKSTNKFISVMLTIICIVLIFCGCQNQGNSSDYECSTSTAPTVSSEKSTSDTESEIENSALTPDVSTEDETTVVESADNTKVTIYDLKNCISDIMEDVDLVSDVELIKSEVNEYGKMTHILKYFDDSCMAFATEDDDGCIDSIMCSSFYNKIGGDTETALKVAFTFCIFPLSVLDGSVTPAELAQSIMASAPTGNDETGELNFVYENNGYRYALGVKPNIMLVTASVDKI